MTNSLHIIEHDGLYGLADVNDYEIVECVYDKIKPLSSGKYIVIKDKMAGILSNDGKILVYPQVRRIYYIEEIDVFQYKEEEKRIYFTFIKSNIYYISVDKIRYSKNLRIVSVWKDGKLKVYNSKFVPIQIDYDQIEPTDFTQGNSRFYLGEQNGSWGVFCIKRQRKHEPEVVVELYAVYENSEEALLALKNSRHKKGRRHKKQASTDSSAIGNEDDKK